MLLRMANKYDSTTNGMASEDIFRYKVVCVIVSKYALGGTSV